MGVSLIQSNAAGWGCHLVVPGTGIFLQNRGIGFSLCPRSSRRTRPRPATTAHPRAGAGDQRRPIWSPCSARRAATSSRRWCCSCWPGCCATTRSPGQAMRAPRWTLGDGGFSTWSGDGPQVTTLESTAPESWEIGLIARGHRVVRADPDSMPVTPTPSSSARRHAGRGIRSPRPHRGRHRLVIPPRLLADSAASGRLRSSRSGHTTAEAVLRPHDGRQDAPQPVRDPIAATTPCARRASPAPGRSPAPATR